VGVIGVTVLVAVLAVSRITGGVFDYLVRWWWPLAALWWAAVVWVLGRAGAARLRGWSVRGRPATSLVPVVVVVAAVVLAGRAGLDTLGRVGDAQLPAGDWGPSMAALTPSVAPIRDVAGGAPVLLRNVGPLAGWAGDAYSAQLAQGGVDVRVDDTGINRYKFGPHRLPAGGTDPPVIWLVTGSWIDDFDRAHQGRELARFDPLAPPDRRLYREVEHGLRLAFRAADRPDLEDALDDGASLYGADQVAGVDRHDLDTVEEGRRRGVPVALFLFPDARSDLPEHHP
jgi:hypothetical protein